MPRALLRIEGPTVELSAPDAAIALADGRKLALKGTFSVDLSEPLLRRRGTLTLKGQAPLSLAIELFDRAAPHVLKDRGVALAGSEGKIDGNFNISLPLAPQMQLQEAKIEGKLRVSDAKIRKGFGAHDIQGINVDVDLSSSAIDAKGKFLIRNVPATVSGQYIYGAAPDKQPPLRISAVLYDNERAELGLDINELVQGEVSTEITVVQNAKGEPLVHLRADLTNAQLTLESLAWSKPVGKRAVFEFDIVKGTSYPFEMHNVRLDGENVAIAGWMGAGADFRVREYRFPQFSLNVVSNFSANGKLRPDKVWEVTAKGVTFDGRDLFRSFYSAKPEKLDKHREGFDVHAEFDTVLGSLGTSLRNVKLSMQKRHGRMTQLETRGALVDGRGRQQSGKQLEAYVRPEPGRPRMLVAKSNDAGTVFKLVGFLPHVVGGEMQLEVNLDGKGPAERSGLLVATHFHMLGNEMGPDPFKTAEQAPRKRAVERENPVQRPARAVRRRPGPVLARGRPTERPGVQRNRQRHDRLQDQAHPRGRRVHAGRRAEPDLPRYPPARRPHDRPEGRGHVRLELCPAGRPGEPLGHLQPALRSGARRHARAIPDLSGGTAHTLPQGRELQDRYRRALLELARYGAVRGRLRRRERGQAFGEALVQEEAVSGLRPHASAAETPAATSRRGV